jgi:hypothetical protein
MLRLTLSRPICPSIKHPSGHKTRFSLLSDSWRFVDVERPLWREDVSVVYNCCWSSPAQSFSGPSPAGLIVSDSRLHEPGGSGPRIYIPQEEGDPVIHPGTGFPFRRLQRRVGLRWRYSNPPPNERSRRLLTKSESESESESELLHVWRFTAICLGPKPLEDHELFFLELNPCGHIPYVTSSLTRRWGCFL